ncbi:hypothetical protein AB0C18_37910 [Nonomuraea muscovyensis]|uniref:hypothetical protein n=1 Tax=Nonomuraea muscovyensis TaxID=1124761 RepID=UPI0033C809B5
MDPLSFPVLAGAALGQAFGFLFGRLAHLLDNRGKDLPPEPVENLDVLEGALKPLQADFELVEQHIEELETLSGALGVYERNPDRLHAEDQQLLRRLGRLRVLLEEIYGQHITFKGERRSPSGADVIQRMTRAEGDVIGVDGVRIRSARVSQDIDVGEPGSRIVGIQGEEIG